MSPCTGWGLCAWGSMDRAHSPVMISSAEGDFGGEGVGGQRWSTGISTASQRTADVCPASRWFRKCPLHFF